ncbi:hypothetical protein [Luteibacter sp. 329MFSha]|uniref:hypothetical protein n=1 Tax=Luteibacter sp. 329MFSha TaxID=1798239 RepID=UPI00111413BC|nr:hypothetical protein [Luteibacter sp. 329MFSha]
MKISNFVEIRADGNVVPSTMTVEEMLGLGWSPSKVIALEWTYNGAAVNVAAPLGVLGVVVQGGNFVATIPSDGMGRRQIVIVSPDGDVYGRIEPTIWIKSVEVHGAFGWFEPARNPGEDLFGVVFQSTSGQEFLCGVSALSLRIVDCALTR